MNGMFATFERELRSYFCSPLAYLVLAGFLFINGIGFATLISVLNDAPSAPGTPLKYFFGGSILFWMAIGFVCPVLAMRLISEERRSGTIEVLMTAPVTASQVVAGKYLAALVFYVFLWLPTIAYAAIVAVYGELDWGPVASSYLGVLGIGALFLAIGMFASSLSRSQVVAAVAGFAMVFVLFVVGLVEFLVRDATLREILGYLNLLQHMEDFSNGVVDTRRLVYYASVSLFLLALTAQALEAKKWR